MKKYKGTFYDRNDVLITVEITPTTGSVTETVNIKFPFDSPVIIEQNSDGVFSPIKDRGCTITLFTDEIYWDIYTASSTGYYVKIYSSDLIYFTGYLTPCVYTQDYAYKSEIELEAVDELAVLETFDYTTTSKDITTIQQLINKIVNQLPFIPVINNLTSYDLTKLYIQESNFFDDDDEPSTCKSIFEEIGNYLGVTFLTYNGAIYIKEYNTLSNPTTLTVNNYGAGTPSVELDEVYNKIKIGCDMYEVKDLTDEIFDDENKKYFNELKNATNGYQIYSDYTLSFRKWNHHTTDNHRFTMMLKPYMLVDSTIADNKKYKVNRWHTYKRKISNLSLTTDSIDTMINNDCKQYKDVNGNYVFVPQYTGAYPIRQYVYNKADGIGSKTSVEWKDYILFPSLLYENVDDNTRTSFPALTFNNDDNLAYSQSGGTGYLIINAGLWVQAKIGLKDGPDEELIWFSAYKNGTEVNNLSLPIVLENMDMTFNDQNIQKRGSSDANYNKGWEIVKAQLKIGDKYWNGTVWTTTASTFYIPFHDDDATNGNDETISYFKWLCTASNPNISKLTVGDVGYAIPITAADKINGAFEFTIYTPYQIAKIDEDRHVTNNTENNFFMKDISVTYQFNDNTNWADDVYIEDDIVYENIINTSWANEMPEMDLKINSWYANKPISKSFILDENKLPIQTINGKIQEVRLLEKYYNHYSEPKKIFNLNYKVVDITPNLYYYHLQTNTNYLIDSYEMNVKSAETKLKLIEL